MRRLAALLAAAVLGLPGLAAGTSAQTPDPQAPPQGRIRVTVDVIPVDVQVLDRLGRPVPDLGPEAFTVTINGRRRRVVSAEQIRTDLPGPVSAGDLSPGSPGVPGRVIMLAVDCISFDATASRDVIQSVGQFVRSLLPEDYVGLSVYPNGVQLAPTRDHPAILRALTTVVGQRDGPGMNQFNLRPTEIIDMTRDISSGSGPTLDAVVMRECGQEQEANCRFRLMTEVTNTALYYEGMATASLGMLRTLVTQMRSYPGRKTLVLVSGGLVASDSPGGRPDIGSLGLYVGREAAAANTAIYTLFIDSTLHDQYAAETRAGIRTATNRARDTSVLSRWLEQFTGAAGGALFTVQVGSAEPALERIRAELASYYLLGVEPADEDRNGRTHEVSVRVRQSQLTIRGRRWVMIPKRDTPSGVAAAPSAPVAPTPVPPAAEAEGEEAGRAMPAEVVALAGAFDRGGDAFARELGRTRDLTSLIRGVRLSDSPWPHNRRRAAVFALELAIAGLRSEIRDVREEAGRLLAEYHVRVREPAGADAFECWWLVTEATALMGLFRPEDALLFIPRALDRCPTAGRLHLAHAVVSEQQWLRGVTTPAQAASILRRYELAMQSADTETEARVRSARFLSALSEHDRALAAIGGITADSRDRELQYTTHLLHGQILTAAGRTEDAKSRFRAALAAWPGAQSAQVALMTILVREGAREEAAALAESIQSAPLDQYDPWWMYWLGDYRVYPSILDTLRELAR